MRYAEPLVSIVVPVYNAGRFLADTIYSVQAQTYGNWELLLIDDCSSDGSVGIIRKFQKSDERIKLIQQETNTGAALARNAGTQKAKGRYLAFLDADDLWVRHKLSTQVSFMQESEYAFTFTGYEFADEKGIGNGKIVSVPIKITYKQALKNHIISTPGVMIDLGKISDRSILMMPDLRSGQDAATWWQILRNTTAAYGINEVMFYYRRTHNSLSANKFNALKRTWYLLTKVEGLGLIAAAYNFGWYGYNAIKKRV